MPPLPRLQIDYEAQNFPAGLPVTNGNSTLTTNWDELLWAALTVGRPNRQYVFQYGTPSLYEAIFRVSMIRMALEQRSPGSYRLRRTDLAKNLDPSEKGAINYFLGLVICKLFADKLLNVPWMMHLDVWRQQLGTVLSGRSRPDLVGEIRGGQGWIAMECKGRLSKPDSTAKDKAKLQACRVRTINGIVPQLHVGGIAYFRSDTIQYYWEDPHPDEPVRNPIDIRVSDSDWRFYYGPVLELVHSSRVREMIAPGEVLIRIEELDLAVQVDTEVLKLLDLGEWAILRRRAEEISNERSGLRSDGLRVIAGDSWLRPFEGE